MPLIQIFKWIIQVSAMFILQADFDNNPVNGPKSESMEYSRCGHGEEQRLKLNLHPLENVTKNEESMTGEQPEEVEKTEATKRRQD